MRLKEFRMKAGFTQKELAMLTGVPLRTLQQYESQARNIDGANLMVLTSLAIELNVPFYELIEDDNLREKIKQTV